MIDLHLTKERLTKAEACSAQVTLFEKRFPEGVTLTRELLLKHGTAFDIDFLVLFVLGTVVDLYNERSPGLTTIDSNSTPSDIKRAIQARKVAAKVLADILFPL